MRRWVPILTGLLLVFHTNFLAGQRVLYSPFISGRSAVPVNVAGKAGDYYWIQTEKEKPYRRNDDSRINYQEEFELYDERMNAVRTVSSLVISESVLKEYFVASDSYFDELVFTAADHQTNVLLHRFSPEGDVMADNKIIASFPFTESGNAFILIRSADKSKILLLGFEPVVESPPKLHAVLFDRDWHQLRYLVYDNPLLTQPIIQDDFASYPIEYFNNNPVKLTNNGQWLMAARSRINRNYLLFHFNAADSTLTYKEIKLPPSSTMEDIALFVNEETREVFAGILSRFRYRAIKNVQVIHYSMDTKEFDFDSSYRFNTLVSNKVKNENLIQESFIVIPGRGFMLLKEYGRNYSNSEDITSNNMWDPDVIMANNVITHEDMRSSYSEEGYTRYNMLGGTRRTYNRGDLNVFYFPAYKTDSCWSGIISKEQLTELNSPYLSYLIVPSKGKLFFLYNSFISGGDQYGSTTTLDHQGNLLSGEGVAFWKYNNTLSFQQSRQISENEIAIPYEKYQRNGFAIIRF